MVCSCSYCKCIQCNVCKDCMCDDAGFGEQYDPDTCYDGEHKCDQCGEFVCLDCKIKCDKCNFIVCNNNECYNNEDKLCNCCSG